MRRKLITKLKGKNAQIDSFDSVSEFFAVCNAKVDEYQLSSASRQVLYYCKDEKKSFRGLSLDDIAKYKHGYPEGVEALSLLPELTINKGGVKYAYKWNDQDGDDMSMERYYEAMPCMRKRYKTTGQQNSGNRFVEVKIRIDENGNVDYKAMLWKAYAACRIIDQLESQGVRVKVTLAIRCELWCNDPSYGLIDITVKNFNEPLNISLVAATCAPWFFRYWGFIYFAKTYSLTDDGIGRAYSFRYIEWEGDKTDTERKDMIRIDNGECLSDSAAENFIKALTV